MFSRLGSVSLLLAIVLVSGACRRTPQREMEILAVLPVENLAGDPGLNWLARGVQMIVVAQLSGIPKLHVFPAASYRDVAAGRATQVLEGYFVRKQQGVELRAVLRDAERQKTVRSLRAEVASAGAIVGLADGLARQVHTSAHPFSTVNEAAAKEFALAASATEAAEAIRHLEQAVALDPAFAAAHVLLAQQYVQANQPARAVAVVKQALTQKARLSPLDARRLELLQARLVGDQQGMAAALGELAKLTPQDAEVHATLGNLLIQQGRYSDSIAHLKQAAALTAERGPILNLLGYAYALSGNLSEAEKALEEYRRVAPADANALDSLGEINFYYGRFAEAERYFLEAHQKNSQFLGGGHLYRAAFARLMTGDQAGADRLFQQFLDFRRHDGLEEVYGAIWSFTSGRRRAAIERLRALSERAAAPAAVRAVSAAHLAFWQLQMGERTQAWASVRQGLLPGLPPAVASLVSRVAFLAQPSAPVEEWRRRAEQIRNAPADFQKRLLAWALLLDNKAPAAAPICEELSRRGVEGGLGEAPVLLAWAQVLSGEPKVQPAVVQHYPIPPRNPADEPGPLWFPRIFLLKALAAQQEGRKEEASKYARLFLLLSGDLRLGFHEEERALRL